MGQLSTYCDAGRLLLAQALVPMLTHLAVGNGLGTDAPAATDTALRHEIGRVRYLERLYVAEDPAGAIIVGSTRYSASATPTRTLYFRFRFLSGEALGQWSEMGLFGGSITYIGAGYAVSDSFTAGDDHANTSAIVVQGAWTYPNSGSAFVAVAVGGGSGVARVEISTPTVYLPSAVVEFGVPITLPGTGLTITFSGGVDHVLTFGDIWAIDGTIATPRAEYAANGVYDAVTNPSGQVLAPGTLFRLIHVDPAETKAAASVDVQLVVEVVRNA